MKKLTVMLLALCMLMAVVPALGEDASGIWYITLADVTLGSLQLNEDGTVEAQLPGTDPYTGNWSADGNKVTIEIQGAPMDFSFDGTTLSSEEFPLPVGREPGRVSMELIQKMMNGEEYELPEGMTQIDLAAIALEFAAEYQRIMSAFSGSTGSDTSAATPTEAPAEPELTILQENFMVTESYSGFRGIYIAKVQNNTEAPFFITGGTMQLKDADGSVVGESKYPSTCGSKYLEPGEISFISIQADLSENIEVTMEKTIEVRADYNSNTDKALTITGIELRKGGEYTSDSMRVTVTNDTGAPLSGLEVIFVLEDAEGNLLQLSSDMIYRHELADGSTITMVYDVDSRVADYCKANGIEPVNVEACAWQEIRDY